MGFKSLKEVDREPVYIITAGDDKHRLGFAGAEQIEVVNI